MASDGRYIANEKVFKNYAFTALKEHFAEQKNFEQFYASLRSDEVKDEFLRVASFYLFLVKQGDWHVEVDGSKPLIDYFTNSFKLAAVFSLIDSLSDEKHQEFYEWLCTRNAASTFPISTREVLSKLYDEYKDTFGSIRRCVSFFDRLSESRKEALCRAIQVDRRPLSSIRKVAQLLYNLRSKFVHEGRLAVQLEEGTVLSVIDDKVVRTDISIKDLLHVFEEGLIAYFNDKVAGAIQS